MSRLLFTSYSSVKEYKDPVAWLKRIRGYTGILESLAIQHQVMAIEHINYEGQLEQGGVIYHFLKLEGRSYRYPWRMHQFIKKQKPDVVFINGFIYPMQVIQLKMILGRRSKIVILHRAEKPFTGWKKKIQQLADHCVDAYLFSSVSFSELWKSHISTAKIHGIIQASSVFKPSAKKEARMNTGMEGTPIFLWVGGLLPNKDPITVARAFLKYCHTNPKARLYMIFQADDLKEEIKKLTTEHVHGLNIILVGSVEHDRLGDWFNAADFFVSASHYEGSGVALSEAMSCGCIPITSDIISFEKMKDNCGLTFKAGNEVELLNRFQQTASMNMEAEREKVLMQFRQELSFEAIARKINTLIKQL